MQFRQQVQSVPTQLINAELVEIFVAKPTDRVEHLLGLLSPEEMQRACRFRFEPHRRDFIVAHAALRKVLGFALGRKPSTLVFSRGPHGKPSMEGIQFSLSHSGGLTAIAIARVPVGLDIEEMRSPAPLELISEIFSPAEARSIRSNPFEFQERALYRCWTRKEALLKALGTGLECPLDSVEVSSGRDCAILAVHGAATAAAGWSLRDFTPGDRHCGAICVAAETIQIQRPVEIQC